MNTKKREGRKPLSRRAFLKKTVIGAGAASTAPHILTVPLFGNSAPSSRINLGCIGVGRMGRDDLRDIIGFKDVRIVAVCDVDSIRLQKAKTLVEQTYAADTTSGAYKGCDTYEDFRELLARPDIDAVQICTPDHWHVIPALAATRAGKDIFMQKPFSLTIRGGRVLSDTVRQYGNIFMVGSQQRSDQRFRFACELVRNGRIGELKTIKVGFGTDPGTGIEPDMPVPKNLDYDMWLGPAPSAPYTEKRVHPQHDYSRPGWLRIQDYGAGMITGWGSHHLDIAHWGMGCHDSGPVEIEGWAEFPEDGLWDVHGDFRLEYRYASGVRMICTDNKVNKQGVLFEGSEGWIYVRRGFIDSQPRSLLTSRIQPGEIHLYKSNNHKRNFIESMRSRSETVAPAENGHRSCTACLLGSIAMTLRRKLRWDPDREMFSNDDEANRLTGKPMRSPWIF